MDNSMLKKFAAKQRQLLLTDNDEPSAYFGFMRLCAMAYADSTLLDELCSAPSECPCALFMEKCRQLGERYGGIFSLYSELPVPPAEQQGRSEGCRRISGTKPIYWANSTSTSTSHTGARSQLA